MLSPLPSLGKHFIKTPTYLSLDLHEPTSHQTRGIHIFIHCLFVLPKFYLFLDSHLPIWQLDIFLSCLLKTFLNFVIFTNLYLIVFEICWLFFVVRLTMETMKREVTDLHGTFCPAVLVCEPVSQSREGSRVIKST